MARAPINEPTGTPQRLGGFEAAYIPPKKPSVLRAVLRKLAGVLIVILLVAVVLVVGADFYVRTLAKGQTFEKIEDIKPGRAALVLGTSPHLSDGRDNTYFQGRIKAAADLYKAGKVTFIIVSGDNRTPQYNEPLAMRRWLLRQGVPAGRIVADFAGRRTYASLKRARTVFGLERAVLVTSDFHMPRALYLADKVGLTAWGVPDATSDHGFLSRLSFWTREAVARHLAVLDGWFPPDVVLGPRELTPDEPCTGPSP